MAIQQEESSSAEASDTSDLAMAVPKQREATEPVATTAGREPEQKPVRSKALEPVQKLARKLGLKPVQKLVGKLVDKPADEKAVNPARRRWVVWVAPLVALAGYAAIRAIGLWVLAIAAHNRDLNLLDLLSSNDAAWYLDVAQHGYAHGIVLGPDGRPAPSNLAFFPVYPALIAWVSAILSITARSASLVVSWTAGLGAAGGLYAVGTAARNRRTGVFLTLLWAVVPDAIVQTMGYTEALFTALAAWALWAVLRRRWITAAMLCMLAGLTRPTSVCLIAAVGLAAFVAALRSPRDWRPWAAMVISPLGFLGFMWFVDERLDRLDGYFYVQDLAWHQTFDGGAYTLEWARQSIFLDPSWDFTMTTVILGLAITLLLVSFGERTPWPLLVYTVSAMALVLFADGYYWSKVRLLMPAFPLLYPVAVALARSKNRVTPYAVMAALTALATAYGVYVSLVWHYSP
jgi:hypothetical protein